MWNAAPGPDDDLPQAQDLVDADLLYVLEGQWTTTAKLDDLVRAAINRGGVMEKKCPDCGATIGPWDERCRHRFAREAMRLEPILTDEQIAAVPTEAREWLLTIRDDPTGEFDRLIWVEDGPEDGEFPVRVVEVIEESAPKHPEITEAITQGTVEAVRLRMELVEAAHGGTHGISTEEAERVLLAAFSEKENEE